MPSNARHTLGFTTRRVSIPVMSSAPGIFVRTIWGYLGFPNFHCGCALSGEVGIFALRLPAPDTARYAGRGGSSFSSDGLLGSASPFSMVAKSPRPYLSISMLSLCTWLLGCTETCSKRPNRAAILSEFQKMHAQSHTNSLREEAGAFPAEFLLRFRILCMHV
jgi:hypothetical protein